ncbi:MAG: hypothetical protein AAGF11_17720 [Myxococcota bacterium]
MPSSCVRAAMIVPGLAMALGLTACQDDGGNAEAGADEDSADPEQDSGMEGPPRPSFSEPASGELRLSTTREDDVVLTVEGVIPGLTELWIDGQSLGSLPGAGARSSTIGRLDADALRLFVRGSMLPGRHLMFMRTADVTGQSDSEQIIVDIDVGETQAPIAFEPAPSALLGERVMIDGTGDDALLVLFEAAPSGPLLHLVPSNDEGWDPAGVRTVSAPGLTLAPGEPALPASAVRRGSGDGDAGRVRIAWRVGLPGARVDVVDADWDTLDPTVEPVVSMTVEQALAGQPAEWAQLGRPRLLADLLVVELWAPVDAESPRPGDRAVVWSRLNADTVELQAPQRLSVGPDRIDLDRLGPVVDRASIEHGGPPLVGVRADQHEPLVLEVDPAGGLRPRVTVLDGRRRTFNFVDFPLATIVGAFGSRTVAGIIVEATGRLRVGLLDDLGEGGFEDFSLGEGDLPAFGRLSGEIAPGVLTGMSVFLVPYGRASPVQAIYTTGDEIEVSPLSDVHCDSVALAATPVGDGEVPLACAIDGEIRLGMLWAEP